MKYQSILFYSRCLLAILAVTGTALEIIKYGIGMLMYYTVQSNLLVSLFAVYMVSAMFKGNDLQGPQFLRIKVCGNNVNNDYLCGLSFYVGTFGRRFLAC